MPDNPTLNFYAANTADYVQAGSDEPSTELFAFMAVLPPKASILELGAGSGRDAAAMLARGFDVDPTDASPELAAAAAQRLGRPVRLMRFDELDADGVYDAVWACASLLHAPASELTADLAKIHRALRKGGLFTASFKAGSGEGRDSFGRYFNYPEAGVLLGHYAAAADWNQCDLTSTMGGGYDGQPTQWLWVTAQK